MEALTAVRRNLTTLLYSTRVVPFKFHGHKYRCFFCADGYSLVGDLKRHTETEHEDFHSPTIVKNAVGYNCDVKIDIADLSCKLCDGLLDSYDDLLDHIVNDHKMDFDRRYDLLCFRLGDDTMTCVYCDEVFQFFNVLAKHVFKEHSSNRTFVCDECGRRYPNSGQLKRHIDTVHRRCNFYACTVCGKGFTNLTNRRGHEARHHGIGTFACDDCSLEFQSVYRLKKHQMDVHDKGTKHACDQCDWKFVYKKHLVLHKRQVHCTNFIMCQFCGESVKELYMKQHLVSHSGVKPFACPICSKAFARKKTMIAHMRVHMASKAFVDSNITALSDDVSLRGPEVVPIADED